MKFIMMLICVGGYMKFIIMLLIDIIMDMWNSLWCYLFMYAQWLRPESLHYTNSARIFVSSVLWIFYLIVNFAILWMLFLHPNDKVFLVFHYVTYNVLTNVLLFSGDTVHRITRIDKSMWIEWRVLWVG